MIVPPRVHSDDLTERADILFPVCTASPLVVIPWLEELLHGFSLYSVYPAFVLGGFPIWMVLIWIWEPLVPAGGFRTASRRVGAYACIALLAFIIGRGTIILYRMLNDAIGL